MTKFLIVLRDLFFAFLNATLILLVLLAVLTLLIFQEANKITNQVSDLLKVPEKVKEIKEGSAILSELEKLKSNLAELNEDLENRTFLSSSDAFKKVENQLEEISDALHDSADACFVDIEGVLKESLNQVILKISSSNAASPKNQAGT